MRKINKIRPLVSIIINNYNYGDYLEEAIISALDQNYDNIEVIVVDDGSTDNSRDVIKRYSDRIITIFKENGGQSSAINAGVSSSRGEIICLLDSDDVFNPNKVEIIVDFLKNNKSTNPYKMVYHLLELIDRDGNLIGGTKPKALFNAPPNLYEWGFKYRFVPFVCAPTSGIALTRALAEITFPIPNFSHGADAFIVYVAELLGEINGINEVLGKYRIHGQNDHLKRSFRYSHRLFPKEYYILIDKFLNEKLSLHRKEPIISFFDSHYASYYYLYYKDWRNLLRLSYNIITWYPDLRNIKWALISAWWALKLVFARKIFKKMSV
jgi:glycosyltransferase involved in cell wall biosynthesis